MSLDTVWGDEPIASPPKAPQANGDISPQKRPRQSLFLSGSDSDDERPPKRATPAPPPARPDVDALFEDLDKEEVDDDLSYKPLAPALDLAKLAKEAEARHARAPPQTQTLTGGSKTAGLSSAGNDEGRSKPGDGDKKGRRVLPKMDEERLVGPEGFPSLIWEIKGFQPKGKGNEHTDLNRLLQIYQYWTHKMYPKTSFKDTINRVEKLCHSKRMQVRLSVWRDEFRGVSKDEKADDSDVIDLTEPTLIETTRDGDDKEPEDLQLRSDRASSRTPSLPPASSEAEDDDFDIDAVIRAEEERLATLRGTTADSGLPPPPLLPTIPEIPSIVSEKAPSRSNPDANAMDLDEASLWDAVDDPGMLFDPPPNNPPAFAPPGDDNDMWDIVDQIEQGERHRPAAESRIPLSGVNPIPSLDSADTSRATNDDDWDEMYS